MKNEDFLEMLGNIDDSIIDECASVSAVTRKPRIIRYVVSLAAVFLLTLCAVLISRIVPDGLLTGFVGEEHTTSENYEEESTAFREEPTSELQLSEPPVTNEVEPSEEAASSEVITDVEASAPVIPENTTAEDSTVTPEETTVSQKPSGDKASLFVEVPYDSLASAVRDSSQDEKKVTLTALIRFCRAVIMPSVIGEIFPGLDSIFNGSGNSVSEGPNTTESNSLRFTLPDGSSLFIEFSRSTLPLTQTEQENIENSCEIDGTDLLLLKGKNSENEMIFSAYFEKNGVYFRITGQGENLSEEEFSDIIKSLL